METSFVVFLAGSAAAFLPIYWSLQKGVELLARMSGSRATPGPSTSKSAFLHCLRAEAGSRGLDELQRALGDMRQVAVQRSFGSAPLAPERRERLHEVRAMMEPLLSSAEIAAFDRIAAQLMAGDIRQLDRIAAQIEELHERLASMRDERPADRLRRPVRRPEIGVRWREPVLARSW